MVTRPAAQAEKSFDDIVRHLPIPAVGISLDYADPVLAETSIAFMVLICALRDAVAARYLPVRVGVNAAVACGASSCRAGP
jgi:hypothetical protein